MNLLEEKRAEINQIDKEMTKLFERRMKAIEGVISYKMEHQLPILDSNREQQNIQRNILFIQDEQLESYFVDWYTKMMEVSRQYQKAIVEKQASKK